MPDKNTDPISTEDPTSTKNSGHKMCISTDPNTGSLSIGYSDPTTKPTSTTKTTSTIDPTSTNPESKTTTNKFDYNYYSGIKMQNNTIMKKYKDIQNKFSTDDQKVFYENQQIDVLNSVNNILFIIYIFLIVVLIALLFIVKNERNLYYYKIPVLLVFLIYPFVALLLFDLLVYIGKMIYTMMNGNAYTNDY